MKKTQELEKDFVKITEQDYELFRLFINNLFNLISYSKVKLQSDSSFMYFMKITDRNKIKHSFSYSNELKSIIYRNIAGTTIFNPSFESTGIIRFLQNFDYKVIKKELEDFEIKLTDKINNL